MLEKAIALLNLIGVEIREGEPLLAFLFSSVTQTICNETNLSAVPEGLEYCGAQMIAGEYLKFRLASGSLDGFDFDVAVKQISEGDTNVTFAIGEGSTTPEQRLNGLIDFFVNGHKSELARYRRLAW